MAKKKSDRVFGVTVSSFSKKLFIFLFLFIAAVPIGAKALETFSTPCANSITCIKDLSGDYQNGVTGMFMGEKITSPSYIAKLPETSNVLGETTGEKHIYVDLATQKLTAFEGDKQVFEFPVSTGKWGRTPTGDFKIWIKLLYTRMSGGSGSDYYDLPNVPYTMFFYNDRVSKGQGYSIHGAYWHNNFGYTMSHGCVNMRPEDAEKIYDWADPVNEGRITYASGDNPGTVVTIYGEAPK